MLLFVLLHLLLSVILLTHGVLLLLLQLFGFVAVAYQLCSTDVEVLTFLALHTFLAGVDSFLFLFVLLQHLGGPVVALDQLFGVVLGDQLLQEVHLDGRNLVDAQHTVLVDLAVTLNTMATKLIIQVKDDLDQNLNVQCLNHVFDDAVVDHVRLVVLVQSVKLVLIALLLVLRVEHQSLHEQLELLLLDLYVHVIVVLEEVDCGG